MDDLQMEFIASERLMEDWMQNRRRIYDDLTMHIL